MISDVKLLNVMSAMAKHASERHAIIADNIANADTPGFKAQDLQPFSEVFKAAEKRGVGFTGVEAKTVPMETGVAAAPNGNNVGLEEQMMLATQNKADHEMALAVYRKTLDMMKMAIGKNL